MWEVVMVNLYNYRNWEIIKGKKNPWDWDRFEKRSQNWLWAFDSKKLRK